MSTYSTCRRCGRPLKNPKSVVNGMGPVCARQGGISVNPGSGPRTASQHRGLDASPYIRKSLRHYYMGHLNVHPDTPRTSWCQVRIYSRAAAAYTHVVIMTEVDEDHGVSVTNAVERIAGELRDAHNLPLESTVWIEHYPDRRGPQDQNDESLAENFSLVTFSEGGGAWDPIFGTPKWEHISLERVLELIGSAKPQRAIPTVVGQARLL